MNRKHQYWIEQFKEGACVVLAKWYARNFPGTAEKFLDPLAPSDLVKHLSGSLKKENLGHFLVHSEDIVNSTLMGLKHSSPDSFENYMFEILEPKIIKPRELIKQRSQLWTTLFHDRPHDSAFIGLWHTGLEKRMIEIQGKKITETKWWAQNHKELRKLSRNLNLTAKIINS